MHDATVARNPPSLPRRRRAARGRHGNEHFELSRLHKGNAEFRREIAGFYCKSRQSLTRSLTHSVRCGRGLLCHSICRVAPVCVRIQIQLNRCICSVGRNTEFYTGNGITLATACNSCNMLPGVKCYVATNNSMQCTNTQRKYFPHENHLPSGYFLLLCVILELVHF